MQDRNNFLSGKPVNDALKAALLDLADNWLNLKRVELVVTKHNKAAIHLYEKFGFLVEGTRRCSIFSEGGYHDELAMARLRDLPETLNRELSHRPQDTVPDHQFDAQSIIIRPVHPDDINGIYELFRHPLVCRTTGQMPSQEISRTEPRVNEPQPYRHRLGGQLGDKIVGMIAMTVMQRPRRAHSANLGMMVHPEYWGLDIGSQLLVAIVNLADNWLNLKRIELDVNTDNAAGIRLYKKFGFQIEGTKRFQIYGDGRWADSYFMARIRED